MLSALNNSVILTSLLLLLHKHLRGEQRDEQVGQNVGNANAKAKQKSIQSHFYAYAKSFTQSTLR